jgi:hypothetical protein
MKPHILVLREVLHGRNFEHIRSIDSAVEEFFDNIAKSNE